MSAQEPTSHTNENSQDTSSEELNQLRRARLMCWINKYMKIEMTDGRVLFGTLVCTDKDANVILSACSEHFNTEKTGINEEPRMLGLVMIPGRHIVSIQTQETQEPCPLCNVTENPDPLCNVRKNTN